jgi:hypothetical protein
LHNTVDEDSSLLRYNTIPYRLDDHQDEGSKLLHNFGHSVPFHMAPYPRRIDSNDGYWIVQSLCDIICNVGTVMNDKVEQRYFSRHLEVWRKLTGHLGQD